MDTYSNPTKEFSSKKSDKSNDGTIIFWYENGAFWAKLNEPAEELSEESIINITLYSKLGQEDSQTIKLIKNGPPRSVCKIYLDEEIFCLDEDEIKINVRTEYLDFDDETVKKLEMPIYEIDKSKKIEITSKNNEVLKIIGTPEVTELDDKMGYLITSKVDFKDVGIANINVKLTTDYKYNDNHKKFSKERSYTGVVQIFRDSEAATNASAGGIGSRPSGGNGSLGNSSGNSGTGNVGGGSNNSGTGALAAIGAGILLLLVTIIGVSMNNRH